MAKINDTTTFPNTAPSLDDHVIGTDVSDTGNDANGETVTFLLSDLLALAEGYVLIETTTLSGASDYEFTGFDNSKYGSYEVRIRGLTFGADGLECQVSTDGGSTFESTSGDYASFASRFDFNGSTTSTTELNSIGSVLLTSGNTSYTNGGFYGGIVVDGAGLSKYTQIYSDISTMTGTTTASHHRGIGAYEATTEVDAIRLFSNTGTLSGEISVYGYVK